MWRILLATLLPFATIANGGVSHFIFPVPGDAKARQAIGHKVYELNQRSPQRIVWGVSGRFAGIDRTLTPNHLKYGIEIRFIFEDGTDEWFRPVRKFTAKDSGWQHLSGIYEPDRPVKRAFFFYRIATPGEAWYDGVTLFEVPKRAMRSRCLVTEDNGRVTLENAYLRCSVLPAEGAAVQSLVDRRTDVNYAGASLDNRLLMDSFRHGGDGRRKPWKAEIRDAGGDAATVEFSLSGIEGMPYLEVVRQMTLRRDSSALDVQYSWRNQPASMSDMVVEPCVANGLLPQGCRNQSLLYPTSIGVVSKCPRDGREGRRPYDVIGGWHAVRGDEARTMAFQFDWTKCAEMGLSGGGAGNMVSDVAFRPFRIPAGEARTSEMSFFPLAGVERPDWIENGMAACISVSDEMLSAAFDAVRDGVFNIELEARKADGSVAFRRGTLFLSPDATATFKMDILGAEASWCAVRAFADGMLAFEAERAFAAGHKYSPKGAKVKPAEVKPFQLALGMDVATPHATFARPYAGGRPCVLFLTSIHQAREIVELMQRIDIEARTVRIAFSENTTAWAMAEQFGTYKYREMNISLKKELERRFDVIFVSGNLLNKVDQENRAEIDRQIAAGAGFVRVGSNLPPLDGDGEVRRWISGNVSPELLPFGAGNLRAAVVGAHREVMLDYEGRQGLTPFVGYDKRFPPFRYQDYSLGVVGRAILWAAKMDVAPPPDAQTAEEVVSVEPGFTIRHKFWKGSEGVYDWTAEALHERKPAEFKTFEVGNVEGLHKVGGRVNGHVALTGGAARITLSDGYGRLLATADGVTNAFSLSIPEAQTGMLFVDACLELGGKIVDVRHAKVVCERPWRRSEYPLGISEDWITDGFEKEYLLKHRAGIYRRVGIDMIRFWDASRVAGFRHMLPYGFDLDFPIYDARIGEDAFRKRFLNPYVKTDDKKYLCRRPCLHDPEYRRTLDARTRANVARIRKFSPATCDCGDENSLTLWDTPFDFCFSEHTLKAFRAWLKTQYSGLDGLNAAWRTAFRSWDAVMPDTTEEARARAARTGERSYAAWADHRRFMELTFCETIDRVARMLHERMPEVPLDMSGTQPPNGWTGMDMWLVSKSVGEPAAYAGSSRGGYLGELIRSFGRPFVKPWVGYGTQPRTIEKNMWDFAFRFLDSGANFWTCFNFLLPDYSLAPSAVQYGKTGDELRCGAARLLRSLESRSEALIHYSFASIHAAQIERRYDDFLKCGEKWRCTLLSRSVPYRYVAYAEIEDGILDKTAAKYLILPRSAALSDREVEAIRRFAVRGGKVVGDDETGRLDQHCAARRAPALRDVIREMRDFDSVKDDGVSMYPLFPRDGSEGRYWGFTRDGDFGEDVAERTVVLHEPMFVYDLRAKKCLGKVDRFGVALRALDVKFFAALPYAVGPLKMTVAAGRPGKDAKVTIQTGVPRGSKACHPVAVDVYSPDGRMHRLYSGVCDAKGGSGEHVFRTSLNDATGVWRIVATDSISGDRCYASFLL